MTEPGWQGAHPPQGGWERATSDGADLPATWGLKVKEAERGEAGVA